MDESEKHPPHYASGGGDSMQSLNIFSSDPHVDALML